MSKPVVYTEEQARHWLWFLARNMQSHGQSMFMLEQLQPGWLLTKWQLFACLFLSRSAMYGALASLFICSLALLYCHSASAYVLAVIIWIAIVCGACLVAGLLCALVLFLRTADGLPGWFRSLARRLSLPFEFILLWGIVRPVQWALQRNGRTLNDDIQPVEQVSWSWINFLKGLVLITVKSPRWDSRPFLKRTLVIVVWACRLLWLVVLALAVIVDLFHDSDSSMSKLEMALFTSFLALPNLFCGLFSALGGRSVELKTAPNLGILLSGRNALIPLAINFLLIFTVELIYRNPHLLSSSERSNLHFIAAGLILACTLAWGRLGGLDFLAHYCLRFVLWRCGYAPLNYARFLNYAATELGFLQKVGGGYVFMHRYLLEYFAGSEQPVPLHSPAAVSS